MNRVETIDNFAAKARVYCGILERAPEFEPEELARACAVALAELYSSALQLPNIEPCNDDTERAEIPVSADVQAALTKLNALAQFNDPESKYEWDALNTILLHDDLNDIYVDVKRGLQAYERGGCDADNSVWEWKFSFETHWREHLVHALYVLDRMMREPALPEERGV